MSFLSVWVWNLCIFCLVHNHTKWSILTHINWQVWGKGKEHRETILLQAGSYWIPENDEDWTNHMDHTALNLKADYI